ncbi:MAG: hypothetical protein C4530_06585 [Desulfobacteraceae bacterium]|nr:MAG: hypothetical protein C4530_06585 [Desulfobacteraceae bacterium]
MAALEPEDGLEPEDRGRKSEVRVERKSEILTQRRKGAKVKRKSGKSRKSDDGGEPEGERLRRLEG